MISAVGNDFYTKQNKKYNQKNTTTSFKGGSVNKAIDGLSWGVKKIENGGVLVDFLFVDMLGMVIPRTYQAYQRNKEELGHLNYKSGTEELIREMFSGPSMFVIPMAFIALSKKAFGESSNLQFKAIDSLTDSFDRVIQKGNLPQDKAALKKSFIKNVFNEAFETHKKDAPEAEKNHINGEIEKIVQKLSDAEEGKSKSENITGVKKIVSDLNKSHSIHLDNSHNVTLKDGLVKEVGALSDDIIKYSHDVVTKIADDVPKSTPKYLSEKLSELHKNKTWARRGILAATFLSTVSFLYAIPIMYKRNKQYPGIDGLVKEPVDSTKQVSTTKKQAAIVKSNEKKNAVPDPFFSGRRKKSDKKDDNQDVSFGSNKATGVDRFFKRFDFNGHSVPHEILGIYTLGLMLGARLYQARNADERREVATRDFSGLTTITFALPVARNWISTASKKLTGIPIAKPLASIGAHFNPTKKPFSFENVEDVYSGPSKLKNGLADFTKNIADQGGDLRKVFNLLSDDSKKSLNTIADGLSEKNTTVEVGGLLNFVSKPFKAGNSALKLPETNEKIVELFKKAQQNDKYKAHLDVVKKELDNAKNPVVKLAEASKTLPEAASIIGISAFLGWFLPWFNINYTKKLYKNKNAQVESAQKQAEVASSKKEVSDVK